MRWGTAALVAATVAATAFAPAHLAAEAAAAGGGCPVWTQRTVASGLGVLESLLPDNRGGMLLSSSSHNAVERLLPSHQVTTLAAVPSPGQLVWHGRKVMFPTGDGATDGALNEANGTLDLLDLRTHKLTTYATRLTMPNGLALDRDGTAYVTRDVGSGTGITRIAARPPHRVTTNWSSLSDTNGIAIDVNRRVMYVDRTFTADAPIVAIPMAHPARAHMVADLSGHGSVVFKGLDDLIRSPSGILYLPANGSGEVFSYDTRSGQVCLVASGLQDPSDVAIGTGHGWRKGALFVCGFDGTVREIVRRPG